MDYAGGNSLIVNSNRYSLGEVISTSSWKTFLALSSPLNLMAGIAIFLMPFYGVIGYSSVTFTKNKKEKSMISGLLIMLYGVILFIFARLAILNIFF
nr:hypothetical protein [Clostridium haemolyticum]